MKTKMYSLFSACLFTFVLSYVVNFSYASEIEQLNENITEKNTEINSLKSRVESYQDKIREKRRESVSLESHISVLEQDIKKNELEIEIAQKQIQSTGLEIQKTQIEISTSEKTIKSKKLQIEKLLREVFKQDQVSELEILLLNDTFSDFFDHYKQLHLFQQDVQKAVLQLKNEQQALVLQKNTLEEKKQEEELNKAELNNQKKNLEEKVALKGDILAATQNSEAKFQSYVSELQQEQRQISAEIANLEKTLRDAIEKKKYEEQLREFGRPGFTWPTSGRYVTARFHDPDYPYRNIFEHPAIDIRAEQGTRVRAAESGYVATVQFNGTSKYAYVMLLHNDGFSTVYGHVSKVFVSKDQVVKKGDVIALTGGSPGTAGSGRLTSGPHLHFEIRYNTIPIDPLGAYPSGEKKGAHILPRDWL